MFRQLKPGLLAGIILAAPGLAHGQTVIDTRKALAIAQSQAAAHGKAATAARAQARADAAMSALLAEQQIEAAIRLRSLENQTGGAASAYAALQAQQQTAALALQQNEASLTTMLPVMQRLSQQPAATLLATPASPTDSVRGLLILQGIAGQIERQAQTVRIQADTINNLLRLMTADQKILLAAVAAQTRAEAALTRQITATRANVAAESDIAASEAAAAAAARQNAYDLRGMLNRLAAAQQAEPAPLASAPSPPGMGGSPVSGRIIQAYGTATVAGPAVGVMYATTPGARVAAPCAGPVLYADHFQSYGLLVIIDCGGSYDFVLSGMARLDVAAGETLARRQPVGQMPGFDAKTPAAEPQLYVELRRNGAAIDPSAWLAGGGSG